MSAASPDFAAAAQIFARYALTPNELGYCGGADLEVMRAAAAGLEVDPQQFEAAARKFSGGWAYLHVLSQLTGRPPLDAALVRQYWTGLPAAAQAKAESPAGLKVGVAGADLDTVAGLDRAAPGETRGGHSATGLESPAGLEVDATAFGQALLEYIRPQAASYWQHLRPVLIGEARPHHAFHVLAVYPWSHLLGASLAAGITQGPQVEVPLQVMNSCLVLPARVLIVEPAAPDPLLHLRTLRLELGAPAACPAARSAAKIPPASLASPLTLREVEVELAATAENLGPALLGRDFAPGQWLSLHWGRACEVLSQAQAAALENQVRSQVAILQQRLGRAN